MRERRHGTTAGVALAMLLGSALIHVALLPVGDRVLRLSWDSPPLPGLGGVMEVALIEPEDEAAPQPEAKAPEAPPEATPPGTLVKLDRVVDERAPKAADKLAEFDSRTTKETRAPIQRPQPGAAATTPGDHPEAVPLPPLLRPRPTEAARAGGAAASELAEGGDEARAATQGRASRGEDGEAGDAAAQSPRSGLRGSPDQMRALFGRPGTMDDIQEVEEGSENLLNTRRWKYASFFNRVRDAVAQHWHPEVPHAARDPEGRIYGTKTRVTRLLIRLNPDGSLAGVRVDRSSDVDFLDEEAIRAVRAAQPFNNPPAGLVDPETGYIDFGFAFIFEIGQAPRIHRYRR